MCHNEKRVPDEWQARQRVCVCVCVCVSVSVSVCAHVHARVCVLVLCSLKDWPVISECQISSPCVCVCVCVCACVCVSSFSQCNLVTKMLPK